MIWLIHRKPNSVRFFPFELIFDICQAEGLAQEWKLFYKKLGITEIIDFQEHVHAYEALTRTFSWISILEGSSRYLNKFKTLSKQEKTKCKE